MPTTGPADILISVSDTSRRNRLIDLLSVGAVLSIVVVSQSLMKAGAGASARWPAGLNGFLVAAYALFLLRGGLWALVLRRRPVSRVYPLLSLAYPLVLVSGMLFFDESATPGKLVGTVLIVAGSVLIADGGRRG